MYKPPVNDYQRAVEEFKREFLLQCLAAHGGNRTCTAQALGLQRTYLVRLIRDFQLMQAGDRKRRGDAVSVSN